MNNLFDVYIKENHYTYIIVESNCNELPKYCAKSHHLSPMYSYFAETIEEVAALLESDGYKQN